MRLNRPRLNPWMRLSAMADQFGPHNRKWGPRLDQIQALGRRGGLASQIVDVEPAAAGADRGGPTKPPVIARAATRPPPGERVSEAGANDNRKGGRPGLGKPWEAEGMSRAAWFRRKKGVGG
jgi:hypothetical protein